MSSHAVDRVSQSWRTQTARVGGADITYLLCGFEDMGTAMYSSHPSVRIGHEHMYTCRHESRVGVQPLLQPMGESILVGDHTLDGICM